jgi:hypothetical protein
MIDLFTFVKQASAEVKNWHKKVAPGVRKDLGWLSDEVRKSKPGLVKGVAKKSLAKTLKLKTKKKSKKEVPENTKDKVVPEKVEKPEDKTGVLTAEKREDIPKKEMGLPEEAEKDKGAVQGTYPMPDKKHARIAKAFARMNLNRGKLSQEDYSRIVSKADAVIGGGGA